MRCSHALTAKILPLPVRVLRYFDTTLAQLSGRMGCLSYPLKSKPVAELTNIRLS